VSLQSASSALESARWVKPVPEYREETRLVARLGRAGITLVANAVTIVIACCGQAGVNAFHTPAIEIQALMRSMFGS
jgi:hypothetical protein